MTRGTSCPPDTGVAASSEIERLRAELVVARREAEAAHAEASMARAEAALLGERMRQANEQLVLAGLRAEEMAEQARAGERAKDEFLAMLGHELRNPLSPILTMLDVMEMIAPTTLVEERALITRQVKHMVRLVEDLLDVSRITGGKVDLHKEPCQLGDIVASALEMVRPLVETKEHELTVQVGPGLDLYADPTRLAQVAANLIANAAKYTPSGGRIRVTGDRDGDQIVLRVSDNGIGIAPDMLPRVFEMFTQEPQAVDRAQGGLGLGLAIVRTLVGLHGGTAEAHSTGRDHGSEFVVRLPARVTTEPHAGAIPPRRGPKRPHATRKILVVDDNQDAANVTARVLTDLGHHVRVAYDGPTALAMAADVAPEVALLDIGLPGMDGYQLARGLTARCGHVRLIAVSGYGQPTDRSRSRDAGFVLHLVKPVSFATLRDAIVEEGVVPASVDDTDAER